MVYVWEYFTAGSWCDLFQVHYSATAIPWIFAFDPDKIIVHKPRIGIVSIESIKQIEHLFTN